MTSRPPVSTVRTCSAVASYGQARKIGVMSWFIARPLPIDSIIQSRLRLAGFTFRTDRPNDKLQPAGFPSGASNMIKVEINPMTRYRYEMAAERYSSALTWENLMEAPAQAAQRKITLASLELVHAAWPAVQV